MSRLTLLALPLALMACVPEPAPAPEPIPTLAAPNACGADGMQDLVGQSAKKLEVMKFATTVRIMRPGQAVTMDYSPERLNILINAQEKIESVTCG